MAKEIPVYLFVGFLESGKTKFIQEVAVLFWGLPTAWQEKSRKLYVGH